MTFDGNNNTNEFLPLMDPYHYYPESPATGRAMAYSLKQAYLYARTQSRIIGHQTWRQYEATSIADSRSISATTWVGLCEFRAELPPFATRAQATVYFNLLGAEGQRAETHHRIAIYDGADTDTGDDFSRIFEVEPPQILVPRGNTVTPVWSSFDTSWSVEKFHVARNGTRDTANPLEVVITVEAYAINEIDGTAIRYRPGVVQCEWVTHD